MPEFIRTCQISSDLSNKCEHRPLLSGELKNSNASEEPRLLPALASNGKLTPMKTPLSPDIRWKQRFSNFSRALQTLEDAKRLADTRPLSKLEQQGLIQGFEFTHELAWNVLKDYLEEQGFVDIVGSKNATRQGFKNALIVDGEAWMDMIKARNLTSHTYNVELAESIAHDILQRFFPAFMSLSQTFEALKAQPEQS
jgi:nucleotidyltransferase substrate binding protein (TIGR01987 family)